MTFSDRAIKKMYPQKELYSPIPKSPFQWSRNEATDKHGALAI